MNEPLYWESTYAIALALKRAHAGIDLHQVSLQMIFDWTVSLPEFQDDPALANDDILAAIYQDWFEETIHERGRPA
ncbi:MAG: Fe-S cluster assembly protein IscX [Anaerolineales bacterium]|nr:Fe-S cluster assembly protein IscX [Anaerolineales bacterium]MCX7754905.1 Fe-S cluster assembly protein IscX [Anaerolineales bacterium]MDW8278164.1 Fe-S cluster assembly protein IscX [Anaerolineales bacterium]